LFWLLSVHNDFESSLPDADHGRVPVSYWFARQESQFLLLPVDRDRKTAVRPFGNVHGMFASVDAHEVAHAKTALRLAA
jgi:hypothetical protein